MLKDKSTVIIGLSARTTDDTFCARPLTAPRHRLFGADAIVNKNIEPVALAVRLEATNEQNTPYQNPFGRWRETATAERSRSTHGDRHAPFVMPSGLQSDIAQKKEPNMRGLP